MTIHYHGTPITPNRELMRLAGRNFCVSHYRPDQVEMCHRLGQSVMLDNGAFSFFTALRRELEAARRAGTPMTDDEFYEKLHVPRDWNAYYAWADVWLDFPTTWAVIPDVIDAGSQEQDALIRQWPHGDRGAPVWHTDEPLDRLYRLCDEWPKVCFGSTGEHWQVLSDAWCGRVDEAFNGLAVRHRRMPWIHMLRGGQLGGREWPFASLDATNIAQNHHQPYHNAGIMAQRLDAANCPPRWKIRHGARDLFEEAP